MTAYTDATKIAAHLGVALTPEQATQADVVAEAVTAWIDQRTGRTWQNVAGSVAGETHVVTGGSVWLAYRPVTAVASVNVRATALDDWAQMEPTAFALADPMTGRVDVPGVPDGYGVLVDYAHTAPTPPADLAYAATVIAADIMFTALHPESAGVEQIAVGQNDVSLRYASGGAHSAGADLALRIVDSYRRVVFA